MKNKPDGGPYHPTNIDGVEYPGITVRQYYVGQAIKGLVQGCDLLGEMDEGNVPHHWTAAQFCHDVADANIALEQLEEKQATCDHKWEVNKMNPNYPHRCSVCFVMKSVDEKESS